jgi:hypothetical protein
MNPHVLTIDPQGVVTGLYTEMIELQSLGPLEITRATSIEFNGQKQQWEVKDLNQHLLFSHASRSVCLAWEQQHFNR